MSSDIESKREAREEDPLLKDTTSSCYKFFGLHAWCEDFVKEHGYHLVLFIVVQLFLFKGIVGSLALENASLFIYKDYGISSLEIQVFQAAAVLPWSMKPVIGLISDMFPIGGYNKFPYAFSASVLGILAFAAIGSLGAGLLPLPICVALMFCANYNVVCVDVLQQGTFASRVQASKDPTLRSSFISFYWQITEAGSILGLLLSGLVIQYWSPRFAFLMSAACAAVIMAMVWNNFYCEEQVDIDRLSKIQAFTKEHWEIWCVCACMLTGVIVSFSASILIDDVVVRSCIAILSAIMVVCSIYVLLPGVVGQVGVYAVLSAMMYYSISGPDLFFCTDTLTEYPKGPHFSSLFFSSGKTTAQSVGFLVGISTYGNLAKGWTYGKWLVLANFASVYLNLPSVMFYCRANVALGIPDSIWILVSSALVGIAAMWRWMPLFAIFNFLCPPGMEAAIFGILMGAFNLGFSASGNVGTLVLEFLKVSPAGDSDESSQFDHLWLASLCAPVVALGFSLVMLPLLPDEEISAAGRSSCYRATWSSKASSPDSFDGGQAGELVGGHY